MNKRELILSICIPTFNRCELLDLCLHSILEQIVQLKSKEIEIVISNNASTDNTARLIQDIQLQYPKILIRSFIQEKNIGAVNNLFYVVKLAEGKYIYIVSDDDVLLPGAMDNIIDSINTHSNVSVIIPKVVPFDNSINEIIYTNNELKDIYIADKNEIFVRMGTMITFISSMIFLNSIVKHSKIFNSKNLFPHSFLFLSAINDDGGGIFLSSPGMGMRNNYNVKYNLLSAFIIDFYDIIKYAKELRFSQNAIRTVLSNHAIWLYNAILFFKNKSYQPTLKDKVGDSIKVMKMWWFDISSIIKICITIWLPVNIVNKIKYINQERNGQKLCR